MHWQQGLLCWAARRANGELLFRSWDSPILPALGHLSQVPKL